MARSFDEILTDINTEQANYSGLSSLNNNTTQVSIWGQIKQMFAALTRILEVNYDAYTASISTLLDTKRVGSLEWYVEQVKKFQFGDDIQVVDNVISYPTIDATKQIIAQATAVEQPLNSGAFGISIKAVKVDNVGQLLPLNGDEKTALESYIQQIKYAGVQVEVVSKTPDVIRLVMQVERNPLRLNADGSDISNNSAFPVLDAIKTYFKSLPFDSVFYWTKLVDYLMSTGYINDAVVLDSYYNTGGANGNWIQFSRKYVSSAGYFAVDPTISGVSTFDITYV